MSKKLIREVLSVDSGRVNYNIKNNCQSETFVIKEGLTKGEGFKTTHFS